MCVEMGKLFLENVFIGQLLLMETPFITGALHKNTQKRRNGQNVFRGCFYLGSSGNKNIIEMESLYKVVEFVTQSRRLCSTNSTTL